MTISPVGLYMKKEGKGQRVEKLSDIIAAIKNQPPVGAPDKLVDQVMARLEVAEQSIGFKIRRFLFRPQEMSSDAASIFSGRITSYQQCVFLLFMVGFFYLVAGVVTLWGLHNVMSDGQINSWLKIQPFITVLSAVLMIFAGVMVMLKPRMIILAKYGIIVHTVFMFLNALVIGCMIVIPITSLVLLAFLGSAIVTGILLISSIHYYIKSGFLKTGRYFA
ncbi:hypothetical protein EG832_14465 [bacterium]|nr:hypothetical protein [bacterium]